MAGWSWRTLIIIHRGQEELLRREGLFASGSKDKMDASSALITFPVPDVTTAPHTEAERRRSGRLLLPPQEGGAASQPSSLLLQEQLVSCLKPEPTLVIKGGNQYAKPTEAANEPKEPAASQASFRSCISAHALGAVGWTWTHRLHVVSALSNSALLFAVCPPGGASS